ncbi:TonB-dependent receptor, partial [Aliarcobacter lanthieri]
LMNMNESEHAVSGADPDFERKNIGTRLILTPDENNTIRAGYSYTIQERTHTEGKSIVAGSRETPYTKFERTNYNIDHEAKYDKF